MLRCLATSLATLTHAAHHRFLTGEQEPTSSDNEEGSDDDEMERSKEDDTVETQPQPEPQVQPVVLALRR